MSNNGTQLDTVSEECDAQLHSFCYVCHHPTNSGDGFYQLFTEPEEEDTIFSPAKMLCDILDIEVLPELCHSRLICVNCNMLCMEFNSLVQRIESIRVQMTMAYNQTVLKLTGLTEKDLKDESTVDVVDGDGEHLESFNTELMSMEEVFRMEGLVSDSIEVHPSAEQIENGIPKIGLVWQSAAPAGNMQSNSLIHAGVLQDEHPADAIEAERKVQPMLQGLNSVGIRGTGITNLPNVETLDHYIGESNEGMVEVTEEDGTSIYCIYDNVIESYSDTEGPAELNETPDSVSGYDEVVIESSVQMVENDQEEIQGPNSLGSLLVQHEQAATDPMPSSMSLISEDGSQQSYFVKLVNMYYCSLCSDGEQVKCNNVKNMVRHLNTEHSQNILICEQCDDIFHDRAAHTAHMEQHKEKGNAKTEFACDVCGGKFGSIRLLRRHRKSHTATKEWVCEICDKKYVSKSFYDIHMNKHSGLRPHKCTVCSKDFTSKYVLTVHMKTHNERLRTFPCSECNSSFYSRNNLVQHERTHRGVRDFECGDCGKTFLSQNNLNVHKVIHSAVKPFACRMCPKTFARKAEIYDHERTHTGEKPFSCDICGASFAQRSNLYSHRRLTHLNDKRFKCDLCGACFKRRRLLLYHTRAVHTGERPYKCDLCSASFVYPEHFHKHKRIHTGKKPYACEVCLKMFNSPDNRNAHRFVHSDKKPFECVTCGTGFMRKSQLYAHMKKRGHLNDTIVVNQPRITPNDTLEFEMEPVAVDDQGGPVDDQEGGQDVESGEDEKIIPKGGNVNEIIETEQYYLEEELQQQETENLLDGAVTDHSQGNMGLITKIEIHNTDWENIITQD